jgi:hypothetical protein
VTGSIAGWQVSFQRVIGKTIVQARNEKGPAQGRAKFGSRGTPIQPGGWLAFNLRYLAARTAIPVALVVARNSATTSPPRLTLTS